MRAARPDDSQTVRQAIERFQRPLLLYAHRLLGDAERARDIVQETFARLCDDPPADVNGHLAEWLYTVCRNQALDAKRREKVRKPRQATMETIASDSPGPDEATERRDSTDHVLRLLSRLPDNQQEAIRLKFQHGMSYRQISEITGHSESNVGFLIHTGLKSIRQML